MSFIFRTLKPLKIITSNWFVIKKFSVAANYNFSLNVNQTLLNNYINKLQKEYELLTATNDNNPRKLELETIMRILSERNMIINDITNLKELLVEKDDVMKQLASEEKSSYEEKLGHLDKKLLQCLVPPDKNDFCDAVVLEVQAGVGGQEAMLFAKEVFEMYTNYAEYKGWDVDLTEFAQSDMGGIRIASALIQGSHVFKYFKHEAGVHRVQRIPTTEKGGRIHTSTISVIAMPQPTDIEIDIKPTDLKIETKRASGAGGQHVNKTESAVRIVHLPTGIAVECQVDRSQIKNRKLALAKLKALLYQRDLDMLNNKIEQVKKTQVKTRNRNEKIRTYNFNQDRVTDHRLGLNLHNLKAFMEGGKQLDNLIEKLDEHLLTENLLNLLDSY